jgi:hypothetical protein
VSIHEVVTPPSKVVTNALSPLLIGRILLILKKKDMGTTLKGLSLACVAGLMLLAGCKKSNDPAPNNNNNNGGHPSGSAVKITGTSPEYTWWGDELTITGTGFSAVKEENKIRFVKNSQSTGSQGYAPHLVFTSDGGDIQITSASETQLKIRIPFETEDDKLGGHRYYSLDGTFVEVTVKESVDTTDLVKFLGLPFVGPIEYHYGWHEELRNIARLGDSLLLSGGFSGMLSGSFLFPTYAGVYDKLRLRINGGEVPLKRRTVGGHPGWALYLPSDQYREFNCAVGEHGWNDHPMDFEFYVEGTTKKDIRQLYVQYLPPQQVTSVVGSPYVSKSAGGTPEWHVNGKDMYYTIARFTPTVYNECPGATVVEVAVQSPGGFSDLLNVGIPLSVMVECSYTVVLWDPCGGGKSIGSVGISK